MRLAAARSAAASARAYDWMTAFTSAPGSGAGRAVDGGVCTLAADVETGGGGANRGSVIVDSLFCSGAMTAVDSGRWALRPGTTAVVFARLSVAVFLAPASVETLGVWRGGTRGDASATTLRGVESIFCAGAGAIDSATDVTKGVAVGT